MKISIPEPSVVVLIGASGCGKSTFARRHFAETEVLSSDAFRAMIVDDENSLAVNEDAFDALHYMLEKRLKNMRLAVVDATNVQAMARQPLVSIAKKWHLLPVAIVLDMPEEFCLENNRNRADRTLPEFVIQKHRRELKRSIRRLRGEGFRQIEVLRDPDQLENLQIERTRLYADRRDETGPFDVIGDVHGCYAELCELLVELGYRVDDTEDAVRVTAPAGRRLVFLGDLVDRGPDSPAVLKLVMSAVRDGVAFCVPGNHDQKLVKALRGKKVKPRHGLAETLQQLESYDDAFKRDVAAFVESLVSHLVLDEGRLVVAHAGMKQELQGRASGRVRSFALYGETTGETDEFGLPVRLNWAAEYRGDAMVVYGHTPTPWAEWVNNTICIDTGCVFGGALTALRYPERELVSVPAHEVYCEPTRPLVASVDGRGAQQIADDVLDLADVSGKRRIETRLQGGVTIRPENAAAALEVMSRWAIDPRWLPYLPPTMSPSETSQEEGYLEHPREAFAYFASRGVDEVVCEEKHMGSRAVVLVARDEASAEHRFGASGRAGVIYTRTGRPFFSDEALELAILDRVRTALTAAHAWEDLQGDWVCLDCELMPWSAKARDLLVHQYASVGAAATAALPAALDVLQRALERGVGDAACMVDKLQRTSRDAESFRAAYRGYCWDVGSVDDYRIAPFAVLAAGTSTFFDRDHVWHMETTARWCAHDDILQPTRWKLVNVHDAEAVEEATTWWLESTARGGEGIVVKPRGHVVRDDDGRLIQPGLKCRGREYLRIIYGPTYTEPENLERLRRRGVGRKRGLAAREFVLGVEALERFVRREPLRRVHECVFGVLALESEPVDPRL